MEKAEWSIDKASDQRMVYVPKDTVIEFMKKVSIELVTNNSMAVSDLIQYHFC